MSESMKRLTFAFLALVAAHARVLAAGARKTLLVTDYRGTETAFEVSVKGVPSDAKPCVRRLDHGHADWVEIPAVWDGGKLHLEKETSGSAALLVSFADKTKE